MKETVFLCIEFFNLFEPEKMFRHRLRMCMSVCGALLIDVDVEGNPHHRTLPYFHFFNFFWVRFLGVRTFLFFSTHLSDLSPAKNSKTPSKTEVNGQRAALFYKI